MITYKLTKHINEEDYIEYELVEYTVTMENETGSEWTNAESGCIHTATLAVCTVLGIFVLFLGCTGNGVVLFNALTTKRLRSNFDLLIINLAGADFITCTCLAPIFLFLLFSDSPIPEVFCGSVLFLGVTSCFLSLLSIVSISIHRHCRVQGRIKSPLTLTQTSSIVGITWLISISMATGSTLHQTSSWNRGAMNECRNIVNTGDPASSNFMLYFMCPITLFSLTIIATCYGRIALMVRGKNSPDPALATERNKNYMDEVNCEPLNGDNPSCVVSTPDKSTVESQNIVSRYVLHSEMRCSDSQPAKCPARGADSQADNGCKAVTVCIVVILTVTLCWGPFVTSQLVELAMGESIILYQVKLCGIALIFLNSALDPYLYGQTGGRIKHKYAKMLYSFARCEYRVNHSNKIKKRDKRNLEACPLKSSPLTQDTVSAPTDCQNFGLCHEAAWPKGGKHSRRAQSYCNANFTQNILLINGDNYVSKLTSNKTNDGNHSAVFKAFESN